MDNNVKNILNFSKASNDLIKLSNLVVLSLIFSVIISAQKNALGYILIIFIYMYIMAFCRRFYLTKTDIKLITIIISVTLFSCLSVIFSFSSSTEFFLKYISYVFALNIGLKISDIDKDHIVRFITFSIIFCIPLAFFQGERFGAYFTHPNHLAYVCCYIIYYNLFVNSLKTLNSKNGLLIILIMLVTLLTKSSGGTIVSMLLFCIWLYKKDNSYIYYCIGAIIVYFAYILGLFDLTLEKLSYNFDYYDLLYRSEKHYFGLDGSFVWRLTYWLAILYDVIYLNNSSVWFGLGFETMSKGNYYFNYMITDPHNDYLRLFAELGVVGFSLMSGFIFIILKRIWRWELLVVMLLPMCIGNILVNVPYMMLLLITGSRSDSE